MQPLNVPDLQQRLEKLVEQYGLPLVYDTLRGFPGYCLNCGIPLNDNETHQPGNLGICYIESENKRKKPRRNDGEAQDISRESGTGKQ